MDTYDNVGLQYLTKYSRFELAVVGSDMISFSISLSIFSLSSKKSKVKCLAKLSVSVSSWSKVFAVVRKLESRVNRNKLNLGSAEHLQAGYLWLGEWWQDRRFLQHRQLQ